MECSEVDCGDLTSDGSLGCVDGEPQFLTGIYIFFNSVSALLSFKNDFCKGNGAAPIEE